MRALVCIALAACGRFEFSPLPGDTVADARASLDATSGTACSPSRLLCDEFEGATLDTSQWNDTDGAFAFDPTTKHRGTASLKISLGAGTPGVETGAYVGHTGTLLETEKAIWIRAWVRLSALPVTTNALEIIAVEQTGALGDGIFVRSDDTEVYHQYDAMQSAAGTPPPVNTWFCLVWHLTLAMSSGSSTVTSDVLPAFTLTDSQTEGSPPPDLIGFGPYFSSSNLDDPQPPLDVWFDDLIVDNVPLSCAD